MAFKNFNGRVIIMQTASHAYCLFWWYNERARKDNMYIRHHDTMGRTLWFQGAHKGYRARANRPWNHIKHLAAYGWSDSYDTN